MIRFAPQATKQPVAAPARPLKATAASGEATAETAEPVAGQMLIPEMDATTGETAGKTAKARGPKRQKAKVASDGSSIQLDLDA